MRRITIFAVVVLLSSGFLTWGLLVPQPAAAATVQTGNFSLQAVQAQSIDSCTQVTAYLEVGLRTERDNSGVTTTSRDLYMELEQNDICEGTNSWGFSGHAALDASNLSVTVQRATVNASVVVSNYDGSGESYTMNVSLLWEGYGPLQSTTNHSTFDNGVNCVLQFKSRNATVTGTVTGKGLTFGPGGWDDSSIFNSRENCTTG